MFHFITSFWKHRETHWGLPCVVLDVENGRDCTMEGVNVSGSMGFILLAPPFGYLVKD
jgi:hypothetical protein